MSFSFLPWPIYVIMMGGIGTGLIVYAVKSRKEYPILVTFAFALFGIGGILAAVLKFANNTGILVGYLPIITISTVVVVVGIGLPMLMIGGYQKVRDDPERRRILLIGVNVIVVAFVLMGLIVLSTIR